MGALVFVVTTGVGGIVNEIGPTGKVVHPSLVAVTFVYTPPDRLVIVTLPPELAVSKIGVAATPLRFQFMV
jgi:hypothetical protein